MKWFAVYIMFISRGATLVRVLRQLSRRTGLFLWDFLCFSSNPANVTPATKKSYFLLNTLHREAKGKVWLQSNYTEATGNIALRAFHSCVCLCTQELKLEFCFRNVRYVCVCVCVLVWRVKALA